MREIQAIAFESKQPDFDYGAVRKDWCQTRHMQVLWEATSLITPEAERFIMRSVAAYRREPLVRDSPWLGLLIDEFMTQEAAHTRVHVKLNEALGIDAIERRSGMRRTLRDLSSTLPKLDALAMAAAMEHLFFSVIKLTFIDTGFYRDPDVDPAVLDVFLWHWCEELEHHSVTLSLLSCLDVSYETRLRAAKRVLTEFIPACHEIVMGVERHHSPIAYRWRGPADIAKLLTYFARGMHVSSRFLVPDYDVIEAGKWSWSYIEEWRDGLGFGDPVEIRSSGEGSG